ALIERHALLLQLSDDGHCIDDVRVGGAKSCDDELEGCPGLGTLGLCGPELRRREDRPHRLAKVTIRGGETRGHTRDQRRRWHVADEAPGELRGDEASRRRMTGEDVEHLFAVADAAVVEAMAEN